MSTTGDARGRPTTVPAVSPVAPPLAPPLTVHNAQRAGGVRSFFRRHPGVMDAVVVAWFTVPAVLTAFFDPRPDRPVPATIALVLAGSATLVARRRAPELVAVALAVLAAATMVVADTLNGYDLALALGLYAVASLRPGRVAWTTAGVAIALVAATTLAIGDREVLVPDAPFSPQGRVADVSGMLVFALAAMAIGTSVRNRRLHLADLVERANAVARERDRQAELALAGERARIAREMHDVVAHSVSVMIALADGATAALDRSPERARAALDELSDTGRSALADMRRILGVLQGDDAPLEPQPGGLDLAGLVERFRTAGLPVRTTGLGTPLPPDGGLQLAVFRIAQESLTNALRHAPGTEAVDLVLRREDGGVVVEVTDLGATVPREPAGGAGQGLIGMRERVAAYGGRLEAGPYADGWRVTAWLPWEGTDAAAVTAVPETVGEPVTGTAEGSQGART
nr:histidine kinase [uncultured Actinotalea sp.]